MNNNHNLTDMNKEEINKLVAENIQLHLDNEKLKKEQKEFQDELRVHINGLKKLSPWRRFWGYWQLIKDLITTFEEGIKEQTP